VDVVARSARRFIDIEGTQQATVIAAQAFTSLIPFLIVSATFGSGDPDFADRVIERFDLSGEAARNVRALFNDSGEVASTISWVGVVILVLSALSFTRAVQRLFQNAYEVEPLRITDAWRGVLWLAGVAVWIAVVGPLRDELKEAGGVALAVAVSTAFGSVVWLWTPWVLLAGGLSWRQLAPGAAVAGLAGAILGIASGIYMPLVLSWSAERYGLIGVAFALQSWLLAAAFVIVASALVGAETSALRARMPHAGGARPIGPDR
jgi:membrane protein